MTVHIMVGRGEELAIRKFNYILLSIYFSESPILPPSMTPQNDVILSASEGSPEVQKETKLDSVIVYSDTQFNFLNNSENSLMSNFFILLFRN
jgi:hypothetical protein